MLGYDLAMHGLSSKEAEGEHTPSQDVATILSQLPDSGREDDVTRLMDIYEAAERAYRASVQASAPRVGSYASTNG
jgi:hypothetical protein